MIKKWEKLNSEIVLDTPYFKVRKDACRLPNGHEIDDYYVLQTPNIAMVVALTTNDEFVLVEQYKHGVEEICLEIPGGVCEPDSTDTLSDARRELREETGYVTDNWVHLTTFRNNSTRSTMRDHIYLALDVVLDGTGEQDLDDTEDINIHLMPKAEVMSAIRQGKIVVPDSVAGLMMALDWLKQNRESDAD